MARIFYLLSLAPLLLAAAGPVSAATLEVLAYQADGRPVTDAVVTVQGPVGAPEGVLKADMDQRGQRFAPHVLAVHTGTQVRFPTATTFVIRSIRSLLPSASNCAYTRAHQPTRCCSTSPGWWCWAAISMTGCSAIST